jgi:hypothetical protein
MPYSLSLELTTPTSTLTMIEQARGHTLTAASRGLVEDMVEQLYASAQSSSTGTAVLVLELRLEPSTSSAPTAASSESMREPTTHFDYYKQRAVNSNSSHEREMTMLAKAERVMERIAA